MAEIEDEESSDDDDDSDTVDAFSELDRRSRLLEGAYPFDVGSGMLSRVDSLGEDHPYLFCLLLAARASDEASSSNRKSPARRAFEELSALAAKKYLNGEAVKFGSPRTRLKRGFFDALDETMALLNEIPRSTRQRVHAREKDGGLDVVAWRGFGDGRAGQIVLFGQCATGFNFESKYEELQPATFEKRFCERQIVVSPVRGFFMPFCLTEAEWLDAGYRAGILFDRLRIASLLGRSCGLRSIVTESKALLARLQPCS